MTAFLPTLITDDLEHLCPKISNFLESMGVGSQPLAQPVVDILSKQIKSLNAQNSALAKELILFARHTFGRTRIYLA